MTYSILLIVEKPEQTGNWKVNSLRLYNRRGVAHA